MMVNTPPTDSAMAPAVLILSQIRSAEMQPALAAIEQHFPHADVRFLSDLTSVEHIVGSDRWFPDLAVVFQHWPGEYTAGDADRLLTLLPLARWICVRGAWCESDGRNGTVWPDAICVPARSAAPRIRLERSVLDGTANALPLTASRDENFTFNHLPRHNDSSLVAVGETRKVKVLTNDRELRRVLCDLLTADGFSVETSLQADSSPAAIVWDADLISPIHCDELRRLHTAYPHAVIIALSTMAHPEDVEVLLARGADDVVAKLHFAEMLPGSLHAAIKSRVSAAG
jgi:hypothetical protein